MLKLIGELHLCHPWVGFVDCYLYGSVELELEQLLAGPGLLLAVSGLSWFFFASVAVEEERPLVVRRNLSWKSRKRKLLWPQAI